MRGEVRIGRSIYGVVVINGSLSSRVYGMSIGSHDRNDPGRFRRPHANVLGRLVPNGLPTGSKAEMRRWIDLTNEAQRGGTREASLERAEEKKSVDRPDPACYIRAKAFYVHNSRNVAAKLLKHTRNVSLLLSERRIPRIGYHCTIMAAGVILILVV